MQLLIHGISDHISLLTDVMWIWMSIAAQRRNSLCLEKQEHLTMWAGDISGYRRRSPIPHCATSGFRGTQSSKAAWRRWRIVAEGNMHEYPDALCSHNGSTHQKYVSRLSDFFVGKEKNLRTYNDIYAQVTCSQWLQIRLFLTTEVGNGRSQENPHHLKSSATVIRPQWSFWGKSISCYWKECQIML